MTSTPRTTTKQFNKLIDFRQCIYEQILTKERDAQFELVDAILLSEKVQSFPALSLSPAFRRSWSSAYAAMERGEQDIERMKWYLSQQVPQDQVCVFALDPTVWPRPRSKTLAGLRYEQSPTQAIEKRSTVQGYAYSLLAWIPQRGKSWALAVDTRRMIGSQTAVEVGVEQLKQLCANRPEAVLDVVVGDGSFGNHLFLGQIKPLPCAAVVRLRCDRVLYAEPGPYSGWGARVCMALALPSKSQTPGDSRMRNCGSVTVALAWCICAAGMLCTPSKMPRPTFRSSGLRHTWSAPDLPNRSGWPH